VNYVMDNHRATFLCNIHLGRGDSHDDGPPRMMEVCLGKMEARIETGHEQIDTEIDIGLEEVEATNLEANPEERGAVV
jgi:hypothetical protein